MAENTLAQRLDAEDLGRLTFQATTSLQVADRSADAQFRRARQVRLFNVTPNTVTDAPADSDAVRTALAGRNPADFSAVTLTRALARGTVAVDELDLIEASTSEAMVRQMLNGALAGQLAGNVDNANFAILAGGTYAAVAGAINTSLIVAQDNAISVGTSGSHFISRDFPFASTGDGDDLIAQGIAAAIALLRLKNAVGGVDVGAGQPARVACVMPTGLGSVAARYLSGKGVVDMPGSAGSQALREGGIFSSQAYEGRLAGADLAITNGLSTPTGTDDWEFYVLPTMGAYYASIDDPMISDRSFSAGTSADTAIRSRTAIIRHAAAIRQPGAIIRVTVPAD